MRNKKIRKSAQRSRKQKKVKMLFEVAIETSEEYSGVCDIRKLVDWNKVGYKVFSKMTDHLAELLAEIPYVITADWDVVS
jgi:hypothetical protein